MEMEIITPELVQAIGDQMVRLGSGAVVFIASVWLLSKFIDALKAKWGRGGG